MKIKYQNISLGYLGKACLNGTLNSQYYSHFFEKLNHNHDFLSEIQIFPQRIPRSGFFEELEILEEAEFQESFSNIKNDIKNYYREALKNNDDIRIVINWINILLRYGCFNEIKNNPPQFQTKKNCLEIEMLKETNRLETLLSNENNIDVKNLLNLHKRYIADPVTTDREKVMLLNRIIVYFYRYKKEGGYQKKIFNLSKNLLELVQEFENGNFMSKLYSSIAYRGLSMVMDFGHDAQSAFLMKAEALARKIKANSEIEKIIMAENLYTCLQTSAKWNLSRNQHEMAENYFLEMTQTDPYDSTAYSELGFFYIKQDNPDKASTYFKKAVELGPPGTGMNMYYYANCLEEMGDENGAVDSLYQSANIDKKALSPWLDLLDYFSNKKQLDKMTEIANHIYHTAALKEQLDENEIITIKSYLG